MRVSLKSEFKNKLLPTNYIVSYQSDVHHHPQKYIKFMIYISLFLEQKGYKMMQFFPLRTNIVPKHIQIDTSILISIFDIKKEKKEEDDNEEEYTDDISGNKDEIWKMIFKTDKKVFKSKGYTFDHMITTNGYDICIRLLKNESIEGKKRKIENMQKASKLVRRENMTLTRDQADNNIEERHRLKDVKKDEELKKFVKDIKEKPVKNVEDEFKYITDLTKDELQKLLEGTIVCIDPGKNNLLMMMTKQIVIDEITGNPKKNEKGEIVIKTIYLRYSNKQRTHETKRLVYQKYLDFYKKSLMTFDCEKELSNINLKTCNYDSFFANVSKKNEINDKLFKAYEDEIFRRTKLLTYSNTQRSNMNLVNKIQKTFGFGEKKIILVFGDWSIGKQMRGFISTPNITLKRMLSKHFDVYDVDEYKTSCINYRTGTRNENMSIIDSVKHESRELHQVLTYQMDNGRIGCMNRDVCGVNGQWIITQSWIETQTRPEMYKREKKIRRSCQRKNNYLERRRN